jgi:hypothetical protein
VYTAGVSDEPEPITKYSLTVHDPSDWTDWRPKIGKYAFKGGFMRWALAEPYPVPHVGDEIDFTTFPGDPDHRPHVPVGKRRVVRRVAHQFGRGEYQLHVYVDIVDAISDLPSPSLSGRLRYLLGRLRR